MSGMGKSIETGNRLVIARGWGRGKWEWLLNVGVGSPGKMKRSWNEIGETAVQHCECAKRHCIVHFKMVFGYVN